MKKIMMIITGLLCIVPSVFALTGQEIAEKSLDLSTGETSHMAVQMDLIESDGSVSSRLIEEWSKENAESESILMVFRGPASVKNTRFLQVENEGRSDDKWIYLPALKKVRRIASSDGSKSFMGSDATYDDMGTREANQDTHDLLREETFEGWDCYVVHAKPVDPEDSQYSSRMIWIDKETFVPVKMEMYDSHNELLKVLTVEVLKNVDGYWTPMQSLLTNIQTGHATRLTIKNIEYDAPLNDKLFTTTFLKNGR